MFTPPASLSRGEIFAGVGPYLAAYDLTLSVKSTHTPKNGAAPLTVKFTSSPSGGLSPYTFNWSFGDGTYSENADTTHMYTSPGSYHVTLTVTDLAGTVYSKAFTISVSSPGRGDSTRRNQSRR